MGNILKYNVDIDFFKTKSEEEIWKLFLEGKDSAIAYIYSRYISVLYNYGRQLLIMIIWLETASRMFFLN